MPFEGLHELLSLIAQKFLLCMMSWSMTVAGGVSRSRMQFFNLLLLIKIVAGK